MAKQNESMCRLFKRKTVKHRLDGSYVPAGTPGAARVDVSSKKWYAKIKVGKKWKAVPLAADKQVARQMLARLLADGEAERAGLVDPLAKYQGDLVRDYIEPFKRYMRNKKGDGERHVDDTVRQVECILDGCGIKTIAELQGACEKVGDFLTEMGNGPRTKNMYRGAISFFCRFLTKTMLRLKANPLEGLEPWVIKKDLARRKRRALPHDQLQRLVEVVRGRPLDGARTAILNRKRRPGRLQSRLKPEYEAMLRLRGRERALKYAMAASTGFRHGELSAMRVGDVRLEGTQPYVRLSGSCTKNRKDAEVPLSTEMAAALRDWVTGKGPAERLFHKAGYASVMRSWQKDLAAAGIPYRDADGRYFDFHSLRKCLGSYLRLAGVDPAASMLIMRHSDIRLTMEVYNDDQMTKLRPLVQSLPQVV